MAVRTGKQFIEGLRERKREVWLEGERVDVTSHSAFRSSIQKIARLYDLQHHRDLAGALVSLAGAGQEPMATSFMLPRSVADMQKKRAPYKITAEATFGLMGRSPEFLNTTLAAFNDQADYFDQGGKQYGDNVRKYYAHASKHDLFLTHALITPQNDRSKSSAQQADYLHMGAVKETSEGVTLRGARMLATLGPIADELLVYSSPNQLSEGDEAHAISFCIPIDTPGLRQICRRPFSYGNKPSYDFPLSSRFEESDSLVVFNDTLVPWDRIFIYRNIALANGMMAGGVPVQQYTAHQSAVRGLAKMQLATGVAMAVAQAVKNDVHLHVQRMLGECLQSIELIKSCIIRSEVEHETSSHGTLRPAIWPLQAVRTLLPIVYPKVVEVLQTIGAGGLLMMPTAEDFSSPIAADVNKYYSGADISSVDRTRIFKLAWDLAGEAFGSRTMRYERYYAGDPVRNLANFYKNYDKKECESLVSRALARAGDPTARSVAAE